MRNNFWVEAKLCKLMNYTVCYSPNKLRKMCLYFCNYEENLSDFGYSISVTANLEKLPLKWPPVPRDVEGPFYQYFMHWSSHIVSACIWVKPFISCSEMKLLTDFQCPLMQNSSSAWQVCWLSKYFFKCTSVFIFPGPENPCCLSELSVSGWVFHCMLDCSVVTGLLINFGLLIYLILGGFFCLFERDFWLGALKRNYVIQA